MNRCKCGEPEDSPIHVSRYVTGLSGHRFDPEEPTEVDPDPYDQDNDFAADR